MSAAGKHSQPYPWEQRKLGEIATIVGGGTPSTKNPEYWDGDINWYSPAEIGNQIYIEKSERQITELGLKKSSAKLLPVGTVLFTSRAGIGKTAILNKEACTNQGFQSIIPRSKMLNSYFLFSRTNSLKQYGETMGSGSTFVEVSGKQMSKMPLFIPNINEQSKIAKLFQSLDRTITLHEEKYRQLERLKKALLQKMFADETGYPALRFKGFTEKWEHHKFKDVLKTHSFRQYLAEPQDNGNFEVIQQGDTPIIGYANGKPFTNYKEITLFGDHTLSLYKPIGPFFVATDGVKILSADGFDGQYLFATLERYKPKPQGYKRHFTILKNQNMWFTRGNYEQKKIGEFFTNFDTLITLHQHKIDNLKCLKRALLQKMFV